MCESTKAHDLLSKSIEISKALVEEFPDRPLFRKSLAKAHITLGLQYLRDSMFSESIAPITAGLDIIEKQTRNQPRSIAFLELEVSGLFCLVNALGQLDSPTFESTFELFDIKSRELEVVDKKFSNTIAMRGKATHFRVQFLERHSRTEEARQVLDQFLPELEKFVASEVDGQSYLAALESLREARAKLSQPAQ